MSFLLGFIVGTLASDCSHDEEFNQSILPKGTLYGKAYWGEDKSFPVQILISSTKWPEENAEINVLVKRIGIKVTPPDFTYASWSWKKTKWFNGELYLID